jgi:hypothetical protein
LDRAAKTSLNVCEVCGEPVDFNTVHVRAGVVHLFEGGRMVEAKMWHVDCWDPTAKARREAGEAAALEEAQAQLDLRL